MFSPIIQVYQINFLSESFASLMAVGQSVCKQFQKDITEKYYNSISLHLPSQPCVETL